eukprot:sb/3467116/
MFLFTRNDGLRTLYTGDFRLTLDKNLHCSIMEKPITNLYIDTTFFTSHVRAFRSFPTHPESVKLFRTFIADRPLATFHIDFNAGREPIVQGLSSYFPISAAEVVRKEYEGITEIMKYLTLNRSSRVHVGRKERCELCDEKTIFLVPSIMWRAGFDAHISPTQLIYEKEPQSFNIAHSMHSSYSECKRFMELVRANKIFPIAKPPKMSVSQIRRAVQKFEVVPDVSDSEEELPTENTIKRTQSNVSVGDTPCKRQRVKRRDEDSDYSGMSTESDEIVIGKNKLKVWMAEQERRKEEPSSSSCESEIIELY